MGSFWDMVNKIKTDLEEEKEQKEAKVSGSKTLNEAQPKKAEEIKK